MRFNLIGSLYLGSGFSVSIKYFIHKYGFSRNYYQLKNHHRSNINLTDRQTNDKMSRPMHTTVFRNKGNHIGIVRNSLFKIIYYNKVNF